MNRFIFSVRILAGAFLLCTFCTSEAAIIPAVSGSFSDVFAAVTLARPGDTVNIPPGTNAWRQTLNISGIQLVGAGTNATVLLDEEPNAGNAALIVLIATNGYLTRLSGLAIASDASSYQNFHGKVITTGNAPAQWEIDNVFFNQLKGDNVFCYGAAVSVISHCTFTLQGIAVTLWDSGYGDLSWSSPPNYGSSNILYIEDCIFTNAAPGTSVAAFDCLAGGRSVFRHNTVLNNLWANHGTDSGQRYRGCRSFEIYNNTFVDTQGFVYAMNFRSGTGVVFSNTVSGYSYLCGINNYRNTDSFPPFGGATGFNPWDSNSPTLFLIGSHTGANNSPTLVVAGANWAVNQWAGYTVNDTNTGRFCLITGNSTDTMTMEAPKDLSPITFNKGDGFKIYYCYPVMDQVGNGSGDLIVGDGPPYNPVYNNVTKTNSWPHQVSEPLYVWGNTLNGVPVNIGSGYPNIQENRDFFNGIPKPGYTPLVYPHPLAAVQNSDAFALTNSVPTNGISSPPSSLRAGPP